MIMIQQHTHSTFRFVAGKSNPHLRCVVSCFCFCFASVSFIFFRTRLRRWPCSSSSRPACRRRLAPPPSTAITSSQRRAGPLPTWRRPRSPTRRYGVRIHNSTTSVEMAGAPNPVAWGVVVCRLSLSLSLQWYQHPCASCLSLSLSLCWPSCALILYHGPAIIYTCDFSSPPPPSLN